MLVQLSGSVRKSGSSAARIDSGSVMSSARPGCMPSNPGAVTPTMVIGATAHDQRLAEDVGGAAKPAESSSRR